MVPPEGLVPYFSLGCRTQDCNCPGRELAHYSLVFGGSICLVELVLYLGLAGAPFPFKVPDVLYHGGMMLLKKITSASKM